jgi:hypothetical protein
MFLLVKWSLTVDQHIALPSLWLNLDIVFHCAIYLISTNLIQCSANRIFNLELTCSQPIALYALVKNKYFYKYDRLKRKKAALMNRTAFFIRLFYNCQLLSSCITFFFIYFTFDSQVCISWISVSSDSHFFSVFFSTNSTFSFRIKDNFDLT